MAVYQRTYRRYAGSLTRRRTRFLVLPRYAYQEIFASKAFLGFFVACFVWPLLLAVGIYASYNLTFLKTLAAQTGNTLSPGSLFGLKFDGSFFMYGFMVPQFWMSFFLTFIVGPALISADVRNNGLPLYLSRPFTRADYIMGKTAVLVILLSLISWVPGLLLFLLHGYLAGAGWLAHNLHVALGLFVGSWLYIALLSLISLALSAHFKWKPLARLALFGVFIVASGMANVINVTLHTRWGSLIDLGQLLHVAWSSLFRVPSLLPLPAWAAWSSLAAVCGLFLLLLVRRIQAFEVVR